MRDLVMDTTSHVTDPAVAGPAALERIAHDPAYTVLQPQSWVHAAKAAVDRGEATWQQAMDDDTLEQVYALVKTADPVWVTNPDADTSDLLKVLVAPGRQVREALIIVQPPTDRYPIDVVCSGPFEEFAQDFPDWL
jgi:hypothetical protein